MKKNLLPFDSCKLLLTGLSLILGLQANAQVGINTEAPKATLDVKAKNTNGTSPEGVIAPRLTGNQLVSANNVYNSNHVGMIVYVNSVPTTTSAKTINVTAAGYYYFDGTVWNGMGAQSTTTTLSVSSIIDPNILGYVPSTTANATSNSPLTITLGTNVISRVATMSYNGHSYAAYSTSENGLTWYSAYNMAKDMGGYLATFTTDAEWQAVETSLLTAHSIFDTQSAWIGFAKFSWFAGAALTPDPEEKWITGEQPLHDYSAGGITAVRKSNWFLAGEPNNSGGGEGFVHTYNKSSGTIRSYNNYTSTHPWNDASANANNRYGFIVEFQQ